MTWFTPPARPPSSRQPSEQADVAVMLLDVDVDFVRQLAWNLDAVFRETHPPPHSRSRRSSYPHSEHTRQTAANATNTI